MLTPEKQPITRVKKAKLPSGAAFLVCAAATMSLALLCVAMVVNQRFDQRKNVVSNNANLAAALASDISHMIELYDLSLVGVVSGLKVPEVMALAPSIKRRVVFDHTINSPHIGQIRVLDRNGLVTLASGSSVVNTSLSDRDFFRVHADGDHPGLFVSAPYATKGGIYSIALSRSIKDEQGQFAGVVVGTIELGYFNELFRQLNLGTESSVALIRSDRTLLMRIPFETKNLGRKVAPGGAFDLFPNERKGAFELRGIMDGIERLYTFTQVGDLPLVLNLGVPITELYKDWNRQAILIGFLIISLMAMTVFSWRTMRRELRLRREAEKMLEVRANTDGLTGIANRRTFDEAIHKEWERASRADTPLALLMIDADQFKAYNDTHGHQSGDTALRDIARCIVESIRLSDLGARYGGEEFAVMLPNTSPQMAYRVGERIRSKIAAASKSTFSVSVGVASLTPGEGVTSSDLVLRADRALYNAKSAGRNRTVNDQSSVVPMAATFRKKERIEGIR